MTQQSHQYYSYSVEASYICPREDNLLSQRDVNSISTSSSQNFKPHHLETAPVNLNSGEGFLPRSSSGEHLQIEKLALGENHSLLLTTNGMLYSRGVNTHGQLGIGCTETQNHWVGPIADNVRDCSVGLHHSLFLRDDGSVYAMGRNQEGQCGNPRLRDDCCEATVVGAVSTLPDKIIALSCGAYHSILLSQNGICYSFGRGVEGQLGILGHLKDSIKGACRDTQSDTSPTNQEEPSFDSGNGQTLVLSKHPERLSTFKKQVTPKEGGNARRNAFNFFNGPLPMRVYLQQQPIPKPVKCFEPFISRLQARRPFKSIIQAGCGERYTALLANDGQVFMFGEGRSGVLGLSPSCPSHVYNPQNISFTPLAPPIIKHARRITVDIDFKRIPPPPKPKIVDHEDDFEEINDSDCTYQLQTAFHLNIEEKREETSLDLEKPPRIVAMANGWNHSLLLTEDGDVFASGLNTYGQCGQGHRTNLTTYTLIEKNKALAKDQIIQIGCGKTYSALLTASGEVYVMGRLPGRRSVEWGTNGDYLLPSALQYFKRNNLLVNRIMCGSHDIIMQTIVKEC